MIRIVFLYIVFFVASALIAATALQGWSETAQIAFSYIAPGLAVWWLESRRAQRRNGPTHNRPLVSEASANHPAKTLASSEDRTVSMDAKSIRSAAPYKPNQDNAELIRVGQAARAELEAAALRRKEAKEARVRSFGQPDRPSPTIKPLADASAGQQPAGKDAKSPRTYHPQQDNSELIRVGKAARARLEAAANRIERARSMTPRPIKRQGWVPKGETVSIAGRTIDGMVYVGPPPLITKYGYGEKCRPYIDTSLPVASFGSDKSGSQMPYWPGYSNIPAVCRATYLDWLADGCSDGSVGPGYMFLYFYGLERRFLVDQPADAERRDIVAEVERLRDLFHENHSSTRYLGEFLDLANVALSDGVALDDPVFRQAILKYRGWDLPLSLKIALGVAVGEGRPLKAEWLYLWFRCHIDRRLRTPARRCEDEFQELFKLKFDRRFPGGLPVRKPTSVLKFSYRAASGEFTCDASFSEAERPILDISGVRRPIEIAQKIADDAMDELDKFSRFLGRDPNGRGTLEAHALLPPELRSLLPSGELDELKAWASDRVSQGGTVPVQDVIYRIEQQRPERIGKRQLTSAADTLARLGYGLAPDPRYALRGPKVDEPVMLFDLGGEVEQLEEVSKAYRTALLEIVLATFIAHADGQIVEAERVELQSKVANATGISQIERRRLSANLNWCLAVPPDMSLLRSRLKSVDAEHHLALRAAVISIAHADRIIHSAEVASIEKVYKALGLDPALVYSDLHAGDVPDGPVRVRAAQADVPGEAIPEGSSAKAAPLDIARIAAIRSDTERVSSVLGEIFAVDQGADEDADRLPPGSSVLVGLDPKHAQFVRDIVEREHWSEDAFHELASKHGLLPSGALEAVNEWAFENFDEALLDEYDGYDVAPDIAEALNAEFAKEAL